LQRTASTLAQRIIGVSMNETSNTLLAKDHLLKYTDKPVRITTLQEIAKECGISGIEAYLGATKECDDHIMVALNANEPESHESTFVHELLHIMLDYEKFPNVVINEQFAINNLSPQLSSHLSKLQGYISSAIDHPEIYLRMKENYALDMEKYFNNLLNQKKNRFAKKMNFKSKEEEVFSNQQDILDGLEYFYYGDAQREELLKIFRDVSVSAYNSCLGLHRAISRIGMHDPISCRKAAEKIKMHLVKYGDKRNLGFLNNMWHALDIV